MTYFRNIISKSANIFKDNSIIIMDISKRSIFTSVPSNVIYKSWGGPDPHPSSYNQMPPLSNMHNLDKYTEFIPYKNVSDLLEDFKIQGHMGFNDAMCILDSCGTKMALECPEKRQSITMTAWSVMSDLKIFFSVCHYNALLQAHIDNNSEINMNEIFQEMKDKNIQPDSTTYSKLIHYFCLGGKLKEANEVLIMMTSNNSGLHKSIFDSFIIGNGRANDLNGALVVMETMKQKQIVIDDITLECLVLVYSEKNKMAEVLATINEAHKENMFLSNKVLLEVYANFLIFGNQEAADKIRPMVADNQEARVVLPIMLKLILAGKYEAAYLLLDISNRRELFSSRFTCLMTSYAPIDVTVEYCRKLWTSQNIFSYLDILYQLSRDKREFEDFIQVYDSMIAIDIHIKESMLVPALNTLDHTSPSLKSKIVKILKIDEGRNSLLYNKVFQYFDMSKPYETFEFFEQNFPLHRCRTTAFFDYYLKVNDLKTAVNILISSGGFNSFYPILLENICSSIIRNTENIEEYAIVAVALDQLCRNSPRITPFGVTDIIQKMHENLSQLGTQVPNNKDVLLELLKVMADKYGLSISAVNARKLLDQCPCLSDESAALIKRMVDTVPTQEYRDLSTRMKRMSGLMRLKWQEASLNRDHKPSVFVPHSYTTHQNDSIKKFHMYYHKKNYFGVEKVYKDMEGVPTIEMTLAMANIYYIQGKLEEACKLIENTAPVGRPLHLTNRHTSIFVEGLISQGRINEATRFLENRRYAPDFTGIKSNLLAALATLPMISDSQALRSILLEQKIIKPAHLHHVAVYEHIKSNNMEQAFIKLQYPGVIANTKLIKDYFKHCIQTNQQSRLEQAKSFAGEFHRARVFFYLALSFLELGQLSETQKIFQSHGSNMDINLIQKVGRNYAEQNRVQNLILLIKAAQDLPGPVQIELYQELIRYYMYRDEFDQALSTLSQVQGENLQLSDIFANEFAASLTEANVDVPFVIPNIN